MHRWSLWLLVTGVLLEHILQKEDRRVFQRRVKLVIFRKK